MKFDENAIRNYTDYFHSFIEADENVRKQFIQVDSIFIKKVLENNEAVEVFNEAHEIIVENIDKLDIEHWLEFWEAFYSCVDEDDMLRYVDYLSEKSKKDIPKRETIIGEDDINNLIISLNTCNNVEEFINCI
jgi:hypothetical protein